MDMLRKGNRININQIAPHFYTFYLFSITFFMLRTLLSKTHFFPCYRKYREMWHQVDEKVLNQTQGLSSAQ